jgi:hypothetical protein
MSSSTNAGIYSYSEWSHSNLSKRVEIVAKGFHDFTHSLLLNTELYIKSGHNGSVPNNSQDIAQASF